MKSYIEFISEGIKAFNISGRVMTPVGKIALSSDYADESTEGLRRHLIDLYFKKTDDKEKRATINKCLSTYVYTLEKKLRISSDIIEMLANAAGEDVEETTKTLAKETDNWYDEGNNNYGK